VTVVTKSIKNNIHSNSRNLPFRGALLSGGVIAFAGLGDAFLYPVLPIYGIEMGFSAFTIGLLLSVNRFVRILSNTALANLVNKVGMKKVLIFSSVISVISTFLYGLNIGILMFLIARILWGLCYSGLKIASLNYAAQVQNNKGIAYGFVQAIKSLGPLLILWIGPLLVNALGIENGLLIIALISLAGVLLALLLPDYQSVKTSVKVKTRVTFYPSTVNLLVFFFSLAIDGILVVSLAQLLGISQNMENLLITVAFYILLKKLFNFILSLIGGFLTLRISTLKLYNLAILSCIVAMLLIAFGYIKVGVVMAFLFNTIVVTFSPLIASEQQAADNNALQAISGVSTWWDLGAAIGVLLGIYLVDLLGEKMLFVTLSVIISILFLYFIRQNERSNSRTL